MIDPPDLIEANRFLRVLCGDAAITFQVFPDSPTCEGQPGWKHGTLNERKKWLADCNQEGQGVFLMINEGDGKGRKAENVRHIRALFVDLDGADLTPVVSVPTKPHVVVESSPGRFHAYWLVNNVALKNFTGLQKAIAERFGGDVACCDLPRVMRIPGFWHLKKEPFQTRIVEVNNLPVWGVKPLISGLELIPRPTKKPIFDSPEEDASIPQGGRHQALVIVAARLRNAGLSGQRLVKALMDENTARCTPALPIAEVEKIAGWAAKKQTVDLKANHLPPTPTMEKENIGQVRSWAELKRTEFPPVKWIVKDLLPEGLTILAGRPKVGKSWLTQHLCFAVSLGTQALGSFLCNPGVSFSLSLEDTPQRFKSRISILAKQMNHEDWPARAFFVNAWKKGRDGIDHLDRWLDQQENPRLVVIDTFAKIRGKGQFGDAVYDRDYRDVADLQLLAQKHGIALILVHHQRKALAEDDYDSVSGSAGITGAADTVWILERKDRAEMLGTLIISGRDISDRRYSLRWEEPTGTWLFQGHEYEVKRNDTDNKIIEVLKAADSSFLSKADICRLGDIGKSQGYSQIDRLFDQDVLVKDVSGKRYRLAHVASDYPKLVHI